MARPEDLPKIVRKLEIEVANRRFKLAVGNLVKRIIFRRTKLGFGVDDDESDSPNRTRLRVLSKSYIAARRGDVRFFTLGKGAKRRVIGVPGPHIPPKLGRFGAPARSNLTFTGQMLDALDFKFTDTGIEVFINNNNRPDGLTNQEVSEFVRINRPFLALTVAEQRIVTQFIEGHIKRLTQKDLI